MINILLTFTGFHDPYSLGLLGEKEQQGPVLSLIKERPFDQVYLFSTPKGILLSKLLHSMHDFLITLLSPFILLL